MAHSRLYSQLHAGASVHVLSHGHNAYIGKQVEEKKKLSASRSNCRKCWSKSIQRPPFYAFTERTRDWSLCSVDRLHAKASVCIYYGARVHETVLKLKRVLQTQSLRVDKNGRTQDIFSGGSV